LVVTFKYLQSLLSLLELCLGEFTVWEETEPA